MDLHRVNPCKVRRHKADRRKMRRDRIRIRQGKRPTGHPKHRPLTGNTGSPPIRRRLIPRPIRRHARRMGSPPTMPRRRMRNNLIGNSLTRNNRTISKRTIRNLTINSRTVNNPITVRLIHRAATVRARLTAHPHHPTRTF